MLPIQSLQIINNGNFTDDPSAENVRTSFEKTKINFNNIWSMLDNQGYQKIFLSLEGINTNQNELAYIADAIERGKMVNNQWGGIFEVTPKGRKPIFYTATPLGGSNSGGGGVSQTVQPFEYRFYRVHNRGQAFGGNGGVLVTSSDVSPAGSFTVGVQSDPDLFIDLGDIGSLDVWTIFNQGKPSPNLGDPWYISGITLINAVQNGVSKTWIFKGNQRLDIESGDWGGDDITNPNYLAALEEDFDLISNQPTVYPDTYISKSSENYNDYNLTTGSNIIDLTPEFRVFNLIYANTGGTLNSFTSSIDIYDGLIITMRNGSLNNITLKHNEGDISFWIKNEQDLELKPNDVFSFKFNKSENRVELIGDLSEEDKPVPFGKLRILKTQSNSNPNAIEVGDVVSGSMLNNNVFLVFGEYTGGNVMEVASYDPLTIDKYDL